VGLQKEMVSVKFQEKGRLEIFKKIGSKKIVGEKLTKTVFKRTAISKLSTKERFNRLLDKRKSSWSH